MTVPATAAGGGTALVRTALGCGVLSVGGLVAVAALGDSAAVPGLGPATLLPPWDLGATPSSALVTVLLAVAWTLGAGAVLCGLVALRRNGFVGWSPRSTALLAVAAVGVLVVVPPLGSADHLSYAAYGRIAVQGGDPYLVPPAQWRGGSDPVAGAVQPPWEQTPSVYGPVATAAQALSAAVGDGSLRRTIWAWQLLCGLAFLATGLALDRIAAGSRSGAAGTAARARVAVVWTLNPLLLGQLVLGAHVDVLAAAAAAGAVAVAARRPLVAGALLGAA
ncbi:MAG: polyprenol phosphomannose-dependent alpha 1,6 mannosyltransferase MptB, partial [Kineosporiaceae bacterium]